MSTMTRADYMGSLSVSVDADGLILDTPAVTPTAVQGFDAIKAETQAAGEIVFTPVPEPSALVLMLMCVATLLRHHVRQSLGC